MAKGPDDKKIEGASDHGEQSDAAMSIKNKKRSSSACCAGLTNVLKAKKGKRSSKGKGSSNDPVSASTNNIVKSLKSHFTQKIAKDRCFMVQLI